MTNHAFRQFLCHASLWAALLLPSASAPGAENANSFQNFVPTNPARTVAVGVSPSQAAQALAGASSVPSAGQADGGWQANGERSRGIAADIFTKVAPAVVLVVVGDSYGTGIIIGPEGWVLTNHHVIENAGVDRATGAQVADVYLGRLRDGMMVIDESPCRAFVYKRSPVKDLALLRLERLPAGSDELAVVPLADDIPPIGADCAIIGHPRAGLLWTVRGGQIAGEGTWPTGMINAVVTRLISSEAERERLATTLADTERRKVILSTCGVNPGDSGGPLVNEHGELVGVTFAIPLTNPDEGISLDKFSYHVHLDEVRAFLAERPDSPPVHVPDHWPPALQSTLVDSDGNGVADTWVFGNSGDDPPTGILLDIDEDTTADFAAEFMNDPKKRKQWEFEFALRATPQPTSFFDTDNDGQLDLIMTDLDRDKLCDLTLRHGPDGWTNTNETGLGMLDPKLFTEPALGDQFAVLLELAGNNADTEAETARQPVEAQHPGAPPADSSAGTPPMNGAAPPVDPQIQALLDERDQLLARFRKLNTEGKYAEAIPIIEKMLDIERQLFGNVHNEIAATLEILSDLNRKVADYDAAERASRERLEINAQLMGEDSWQAGDARLDLAEIARRKELSPRQHERLAKADQLIVEAVKRGNAGNFGRALEPQRQALAIYEEILGRDCRSVALSISNFAVFYRGLGDLAEAERRIREALAIRARLCRPFHPDLREARALLSNILYDRALRQETNGEFAAAGTSLAEALAQRADISGAESPMARTIRRRMTHLLKVATLSESERQEIKMSFVLNGQGVELYRQGKNADALLKFEAALEIRTRLLGRNDPETEMPLRNLAFATEETGDPKRAEALRRELVNIREKELGQQHPDSTTAREELEEFLGRQG